jgi:hypothetical protein
LVSRATDLWQPEGVFFVRLRSTGCGAAQTDDALAKRIKHTFAKLKQERVQDAKKVEQELVGVLRLLQEGDSKATVEPELFAQEFLAILKTEMNEAEGHMAALKLLERAKAGEFESRAVPKSAPFQPLF